MFLVCLTTFLDKPKFLHTSDFTNFFTWFCFSVRHFHSTTISAQAFIEQRMIGTHRLMLIVVATSALPYCG